MRNIYHHFGSSRIQYNILLKFMDIYSKTTIICLIDMTRRDFRYVLLIDRQGGRKILAGGVLVWLIEIWTNLFGQI